MKNTDSNFKSLNRDLFENNQNNNNNNLVKNKSYYLPNSTNVIYSRSNINTPRNNAAISNSNTL
jgi:hypothetical protein